MKKNVKMFLVAAIAMVFCAAASANAAPLICSAMKVVKVGPTSTWLQNVSGDKCGAVKAGKQISLTFDPNNSDKLLAIVLTASSLGKNVWVHAGGDVNGSIVDVISISN